MSEPPPNIETDEVRPLVEHYCRGVGADIGCGGTKITPNAVGVDWEHQYNDLRQQRTVADVIGPWEKWAAGVEDNSQDFVFTSHVLEDFSDDHLDRALRTFAAKLKVGGFLVVDCPIEEKYEADCERTGIPYNHAHRQAWTALPDFLDRASPVLRERFEVVDHGERPAYSFWVVLRKVR